MIEGVRLLPWAAVFGRLNQRKFWLDCDQCKHNTHVRRGRMRCGWLPEREWEVAPGSLVPEIAVMQNGMARPVVCPGYSTKLPAVYEAVRAWGHWEKGQLQHRYKEPPQQLLDLIELFNQEKAAAESWMMDEQMKAAKRAK